MEKTCTKCNATKPVSEFKKDNRLKDGRGSLCKQCAAQYSKRYVSEHKEETKEYQVRYRIEKASSIREQRKQHYETNKERIATYRSRWANDNKERLKIYRREYSVKNREKIRKRHSEYVKNRREYDKTFDSIIRTRSRLRKLIKSRGGKKDKHTAEIIGCSRETLWDYLLFTWKENYGTEWNGEPYHIDHFIPLASAKNPKEVEELCHYSNLQMLTPEDNMKKGATICG